MRRIKNWAAAVVLGLSLVSRAFGQMAGDEVVVIVEKTDLKHEATVVETTYRGNYLTVREVNGNWLWVDNDGTRGWLQRNHVILASQALNYFTDELRRNPKDATALVARAIAWRDKGELTNAIRDCTDAIAINPEWSWAYKIRGNAWKAKKEYDLAIADYEEGMRLDPKDNQFYFNRGNCHRAKKNYDKAIADYTEAIRLNPKSAENFLGRGSSYLGKEEYDKALADFRVVVELDPKNVKGHTYQIAVFRKREEFQRAATAYEEAFRLFPNNASVHNSTAWFLATCRCDEFRNGHRAMELAKRAVELGTKDGKTPNYILGTLAAAYAEAGDFESAVAAQQRAVDATPSEAQASYLTRLELYKSGQPYRDVPKTEVGTTTAAK